MEPEIPISEEVTEAYLGQLPIEDVSADGGGQLTEVGAPYDGSGGVVRGMERQIEEDHETHLRLAMRQLRVRINERAQR